MQVLHLFSNQLIPSSQLLGGLSRLYTYRGTMLRESAVLTPYCGRKLRSNGQLLTSVISAGHEMLALTSALLVNGMPRTEASNEALCAVLEELKFFWANEFRGLADDLGLNKKAWRSVFQAGTSQSLPALGRRGPKVSDASIAARLRSLAVKQAVLEDDLFSLLGYRRDQSQQWLSANVNTAHPLTPQGKIGKWRTLANNSSLQSLGVLLDGVGHDVSWLGFSSNSSRVGREQLGDLLESVSSIATVEYPQAGNVPVEDGDLLPSNYQVSRIPGGRLELVVQLQPKEHFERLPDYTPALLQEFLNSQPSTIQTAFKAIVARFSCTASSLGQTLKSTREWEASRNSHFQELSEAFQRFSEEKLRENLRAKLTQTFNDRERALLRELL